MASWFCPNLLCQLRRLLGEEEAEASHGSQTDGRDKGPVEIPIMIESPTGEHRRRYQSPAMGEGD